MKKLLMRSPSGSGPLLSTAIGNPSHCPDLIHPNSPSSGAMPAFSAGIHDGFSGGPGYAAAASLANKPTSPSGCRICLSSIPPKNPSRRAWLAFREENNSVRVAWLQTSSNGVGALAAAAASAAADGPENPDNGGSVTDEKPVKVQRRNREPPNGVVLAGNPDLLNIPGVGPRNLRKLLEKGIAGVAELKQLYKDKFLRKSNEKMIEYLQGSVGIIHKNHAESITTYIKDSVEEDLKDSGSDVKQTPKERLTFCVEGNISVGKSTFLQRIANETIELRDLVEVVPEPVGKWQDIGPDHFNILDAFYAEPQRYAYTFQNYVFVTRVMQERESSGGIKPLRLMERSVFSDRMVFVRAVHEAKWMNEMEISIYDSWFDPVVSVLPGLIPDGFIYLRASPDTCHKRMMLRKRAEEGGVSLDYLHDLHEKHENWLFPFQSGNHGVLSVTKLPLLADNTLPPDIKDRVFYLEGDHMHSSIQKVPALVLDCEPNIDFSRDVEAKRQYASQVAQFFEFVKKKKEVSPTTAKRQQQVLLCPKGGLWMPNGKPFSETELRSLDFTRGMSFMSRK